MYLCVLCGRACCVDDNSSEDHSFSLRHREVLHSHLLREDREGVQSHPCHVTDHYWSQDRQDPWAGGLMEDRGRQEERVSYTDIDQ